MRKENEIRVTVVKYPKCINWMLRYVDPITGKQVCKSSGTTIKKDADRERSKWEVELTEGRYCGSRISWESFRERYENEVLKSLAPKTFIKVTVLFDAIEKHLNPERLSMLTEQRLSAFQTILREERKLAESTISGMLAHLRAALAWAVDQKYLGAVPKMKKPQRAKGGKRTKQMKGRPVSGEEFDRMLAVVPKVVGDVRTESWRHYLRGLWLSGLRLAESLALRWDESTGLTVDLTGKYPMLLIRGHAQKSNEDELLPISPEFCELLQATPEAERVGFVFNPQPRQKKEGRVSEWWVSSVVSDIGEAAKVKVHTDSKGKVKFASAHDLRRSFGTRWSKKVMPATLQRLMRHADISTTMAFYVQREADDVAAELWATVSVENHSSIENGIVGSNQGTDVEATNFRKPLSYIVAEAGIEPARG
jgi:integrase